MKLNSLPLLFVALLVSTNCFAVSTKVNRGPIRAHTFNFVSRKGQADPNVADNREAVHRMVQDSITKNLGARGVKKVDGGGDIVVRYLLIKGNNVSTESIQAYFGYTDDFDALQDKAHKAYTRSKNPDHFEAGTLLIDLVDGKTFKLMKRGYTTRSLKPGLSGPAGAARVQQAVDEILSDVRIKQ